MELAEVTVQRIGETEEQTGLLVSFPPPVAVGNKVLMPPMWYLSKCGKLHEVFLSTDIVRFTGRAVALETISFTEWSTQCPSIK